MPEALKDGDFLELDYTGKVVDGNVVFDTTLEDVAKKHNLYDADAKYGPIKVCLGKGHVIKGLDANLGGKEVDRPYTFRIRPEDGFGQKDPKMIQLVATSKFRQQGITPVPGLQVNMDGVLGTISRVSGGRTIVDFNHPLSGKELEYDVTVKRLITDTKEKVDALLGLAGVKLDSEVVGEKLILKSEHEAPQQLRDSVRKAITETLGEIKEVSFVTVTKKPDDSGYANDKI